MSAGLQIKEDLQLVRTSNGWKLVVTARPQATETTFSDRIYGPFAVPNRQDLELATELLVQQHEVNELHRQGFEELKFPKVEPDRVPKLRALREKMFEQSVADIPRFKFAARRRARRTARLQAKQLHADLMAAAALNYQEKLALLEQQWDGLQANVPHSVLSVVNKAFEDNAAPAVGVHVQDQILTVIVYLPAVELPSYKVVYMMNGVQLRILKTSVIDRNETYQKLVYGHAIVTAREALAVAQGISAVRVIAVRISAADRYGLRGTETLFIGTFLRDLISDRFLPISTVDEVLDSSTSELIAFEDAETNELQPLDMTAYPNISAFIDSIEIEYEHPVMDSWPISPALRDV